MGEGRNGIIMVITLMDVGSKEEQLDLGFRVSLTKINMKGSLRMT